MKEMQEKNNVRHFYDQVGWQVVEGGVYQNARYEDLRSVSKEYIYRCHLRVKRYLRPEGRFLLDAGSGPVQYPEYMAYSTGYQKRVCADISIVALQEACKRLKERGLYVVADVAHLPFKAEAFEGLVSLHTLHHLPLPEQKLAYFELDRVLAKSCSGVVVNGWTESSLMNASLPLVKAFEALGRFVARLRGKQSAGTERKSKEAAATPTGTFVEKLTPSWLKKELGGKINYQIFVWRSVSVRFMRALVHRQTGGKYWLRLLYRLEERFPKFFGTNGQYPIVVIYKP